MRAWDGLGCRVRSGPIIVWMIWACGLGVRVPAYEEPVVAGELEPWVLAADSIRHWDQDGSRWVVLDGTAELSQGPRVHGLGERALVRIRTTATEPARSAQLDAFDWSDGPGSMPRHVASEATGQGVLLRARGAEGVAALIEPDPVLSELARILAWPLRGMKQADAPEEDAAGVEGVEPPDFSALERGADQVDDVLEPPVTPPRPRDDAVIAAQDFDVDGPGFVPPLVRPDEAPILPDDEIPLEEEPPDLPPALDRAPEVGDVLATPLTPESRRTWSISPRYGGRQLQFDSFKAADGSTAFVIRGGVIIVSEMPGRGRVDLSADHVVIWTRGENADLPNISGGVASQSVDQPLEAYLEGDVVIRNDRLELAGPADQTVFRADRAYYDFRTERLVALNAEANLFAPGLIAPIRTKAQVINQFRPGVLGPDGKLVLGSPRISADDTTTSGSRFPEPGYRFDSAMVDVTRIDSPLTDPASGGTVGPARGPLSPRESTWLIDARRNTYFLGPVPVFFWPRIRTTDDLDPPIRNLSVRYGTYFGYQILTDWDVFKLANIRKPKYIDNWNLDIDYLHLRGPAAGSAIGWFGRDVLGDLTDPYGQRAGAPTVDRPYFGYFDLWGILEHHNDVLGTGPAVVTYGPPKAGKAGFQRLDVPSFEDARGRFLFRHMQELLDGFTVADDQSLRLQVEAAGYTDRHFLEQYYKRLFDSGLDQDTLAYMQYQNRNRAVTLTGQVNFMDWITDTQFLPKAEYYRIGDTLLGRVFSYSQNWGVDYANVHTASEVNNPNIFAFLPLDPVSNTSGPWRSGRAWTTHQIDMPISLGFVRLIPYAQGQLMGWDNQLNYETTGRAWGAYGARVNLMAWRVFADVESELLNIHGMAHKMSFDLDYRNAYSSIALGQLGVQDMYDDDTYEFGRRYFALTNYVGGILPPQYDPRLLLLRRTQSPVVFTPDLQDSIQTFTLSTSQRLQTKRGPEGRRRIIDYMQLDAQTTFFPQATRDNFGESLGQTMYDYEWFIGDRTSIVSSGWFEFWEIDGNPLLVTEPRKTNDPFGLNVVTAGVSVNRPPRGNIYIGYSIINTGPIATSALNTAVNYWLSPKWYSSVAMSYDFGNAILLGTTFSVTKIGSDFLTSVGLSVDPQRQNYTVGFELAPRFSPNVRLGSAVGTRFDSRFAPTQ